MNAYQREEMRRYHKQQESMKDPACQVALAYAKQKTNGDKKREEILKMYSPDYSPQIPESEPKEKTAEEMHRDNILKNYN